MDDSEFDDTIISAGAHRPVPQGSAQNGRDLDAEGLDGDTVVRPSLFALVPPGARPPSAVREDQQRLPVTAAAAPNPYRFSVNGEPPQSLDRAALIGRKPRVGRVPHPAQPRLVPVASPTSEVSGTHLELRQEGSSVIVTDMHSTNGTVVREPGAAAVALRSGDSFVALPGTLIEIGDGNSIEILSTRRITLADDESTRG